MSLSGGLAEPGVTYPREVDATPYIANGLPEGWKVIESAFKSGIYMGKTYVRFKGPLPGTSGITTVKKAIHKDAIAVKGLSEEEANKLAEEYDIRQKAKEEALRKEKEDEGFLQGEKREEAVAAFRAKYGQIDGATVSKLPGWRATSVFRESCGQTAVTYHSPEGRAYKTVKCVECMFGVQVMKGIEIEAIAIARSLVVTDESGRVINEARRDVAETLTVEDSLARAAKKRKTTIIFGSESYFECKALTVLQIPSSGKWNPAGIAKKDVDDIRTAGADLYARLKARQFPDDVKVLRLQGCDTESQLAPILNGFFYSLPVTVNDRLAFQSIFQASNGVLTCNPFYLYWSNEKEWWAIGRLNNDARVLAFAKVDVQDPVEVASQWMLLKESEIERCK